TIPIHKPYLREDDFEAVNECVRSTFVSGNGPACREFEKKLADYLGVKHVFYTNSCTTALDLAFRAGNLPEGCNVLIPDFTYTSSALGALLNNFNIKLVDVSADNGNIDTAKIEAAIDDKTAAIVPVDYAGNPADMDAIAAVARQYNLYTVHDTAQSLGAFYKQRKTGTMADASTFSFHGTKNLTTGEGGALVTDDDDLAAKVTFMREKGTNKQSFLTDNKDRGYYEYVSIGNSYVQSNILGALGITQLNKIKEITDRRRQIASYYNRELADVKDIILPRETAESRSNWHIYYIRVPAAKKYRIMDALRAEGVFSNVHYTPLHRNKYYSHLGKDENFPGTMTFFEGLLRLPLYPSLT
ncbi:MAG TPA: DegT/DnrJ/EryC1/StrS aminotransferase family protein, partial [Spirochaetota bacterium]|nr:DegT/DnrJ/EryC1/StrS aminotransferase family protein [Spirochaetota bacterium]